MAKEVKPKIHVVYDEADPDKVRLVRAKTAASALNHCYPKLKARVATPEDMERHLPGVKVEETAGDV